MFKNEELISKILKSEAFASLKLESQIKAVLEKYNWDCIQSPYFLDVESNKYRELDIIAGKRYKFQSGNEELSSEINLLIESKSLSGYHILFDTKVKRDYIIEDTNDIWMGMDSYNNNKRLINILNKTESNLERKKEIIKFYENKYFRDEFSIFGNHRVTTFYDIDLMTSFRETKLSNTKDLNNSVLWKAFQSLNSAVKGFEHNFWSNIEADLINFVNCIEKYTEEVSSLEEYYLFQLKQYFKLHKILVVDADLWVCNSGEINSIKYCRLLQRELSGNLNTWIDVVNHKYFDEYSEKLSNFYELECEKNNMNRY